MQKSRFENEGRDKRREEQDYIEAFNQDYELSRELGLKPEILKI